MNRIRMSVVASIVGAVAAIHAASTRLAYAQSKPDLVVLIAIDQFSASLFDRWRGCFKSGLKRLMDEGIVYSSAYQSHGLTETCAGHSTMLTGKHPRGTGIVANEWFDTKAGDRVYCVEAPAFTVASSPERHVGPTNLLATTLGDWMKEQQPMSRVVAVSGKDRASITMAGHRGDGVFWYEDNFGFTTYLAAGEDAIAKLAPLAALNVKIKAETASPPPWTYSEESCRALEADYQIGGRTWHYKLSPENPSGANIRPVHLIDSYTMEAARTLIDHYQLGRRGVTDLLTVSLSATDFVGHGYGTQGPEMCDHLYRLDAQIGAFLTFLDGLGPRVLVVMTGDNGGSDFVERLALRHKVKRSAQSDYDAVDRDHDLWTGARRLGGTGLRRKHSVVLGTGRRRTAGEQAGFLRELPTRPAPHRPAASTSMRHSPGGGDDAEELAAVRPQMAGS